MLEQQSAFIRHCYERAARAKLAAAAARVQADRDDYLKIERNWLALAHSQAFAERISRYLSHAAEPPRRETVVPLFRAGAFDPAVVHAMCAAFDAICGRIGLQGADPLFEAVARAVIDQTRRGIKDDVALERGALVSLGLTSFASDTSHRQNGAPGPEAVSGLPMR